MTRFDIGIKRLAVCAAASVMLACPLAACGSSDDGELSESVDRAIAKKESELAAGIEAAESAGGAPVITGTRHRMIFTNDAASIDTSDVVDYTGSGTVRVWGYNKEEDARELPDDVVTSLSEALLGRYDEAALLARSDDGTPTEEGIYTAVCTVSGASGSDSTAVIVVIDKTPASVSDIDSMRQTFSSEQELSDRMQGLHIIDNVDGSVPIDEVSEEIVIPADGSEQYSLVISYTDRAGNTMEETVELSLAEGLHPAVTGTAAGDTAQADGSIGAAQSGSTDSQQTGTMEAVGASSQQTASGSDGAAAGADAAEVTTTTTVNIPANAGYRNDFADQVLTLINNERAAAGVGALSMNGSAQQAAGIRAAELVTNFSHTRPDGNSCYSALDQAGVSYSAAGENIAAGQSNASAVVNSWMNSTGHRDNILNAGYNQVGIACYYDPGSPYGYYWVELFTD